jgi:hypothetical protein
LDDAALDQFVADTVRKLRTKLLDLTTRNPLLNFRHAARSRRFVRVIDEIPDLLFTRFEAGDPLRFKAIPDPDDEPADEKTIEFRRVLEQARLEDPEHLKALAELGEDPGDKPLKRLDNQLRAWLRERLGMPPRVRSEETAADIARRIGLDPSFDLPSPGPGAPPDKHADKTLQTLLYREGMERTLATMQGHQRLALEETGVSTLYAAFGFLEWYEDAASDVPLHAPLLLYPLEMQRELSRGQYQYAVASQGEMPQVNITLAERLRRDFGLALPDLAEGETPEGYIARVQGLVEGQKSWRTRRWVTIGLFSFARISMYNDLDPALWPEQAPLRASRPLRKMLAGVGREATAVVYAEDRQTEGSPELAARPPLIADADSSQVSAVLDVLDGKDLVIEGPPGTGKSQTIMNIIAGAMAEGKKILFIAEKMAALNVVKSRLDGAGLGAFCLELHSTKARRRDLAAALAQRLELKTTRDAKADLQKAIDESELLRDGLARYVATLNEPFGGVGLPIQALLWKCQRLRDDHPSLPAWLDEISLPGAAKASSLEVERLGTLAAAMAERRARTVEHHGSLAQHPWFGLASPELSPFQAEDLSRRIGDLHSAAAELERADSELPAGPGPRTIAMLAGITRIAPTLNPPAPAAEPAVIAAGAEPRTLEALKRFIADRKMLDEVEASTRPMLASPEGWSAASAAAIRAAAAAAQSCGALGLTLAEAPDHIAACRASQAEAERIATFVRDLAARLGLIGDDAATVEAVAGAAHCLAGAPPEARAGREAGLIADGALDTISRGRDEARRVIGLRERLSGVMRVEGQADPDALDRHAAALRTAGLLGFLKPSVRAATAEYRALALGGKAAAAEMAARLGDLAAFHRGARALAADAALGAAIGKGFRGLETNFDAAHAVASWGAEVRQRVRPDSDAGVAARRALFTADADQFERLAAVASRGPVSRLGERLGEILSAGGLDAWMTRVRESVGLAEKLAADAAGLGVAPTVGFDKLVGLADALERRQTLRESLDTPGDAGAALGSLFRGAATELAPIEASVAFVEDIGRAGRPRRFGGGCWRPTPPPGSRACGLWHREWTRQSPESGSAWMSWRRRRACRPRPGSGTLMSPRRGSRILLATQACAPTTPSGSANSSTTSAPSGTPAPPVWLRCSTGPRGRVCPWRCSPRPSSACCTSRWCERPWKHVPFFRSSPGSRTSMPASATATWTAA